MNNCPNCKYPDVEQDGQVFHMKGIWTPGRPCPNCGEVLTGDVVRCIAKSDNIFSHNTYCGKENHSRPFKELSCLLTKEKWEYACADCVSIIIGILNRGTNA